MKQSRPLVPTAITIILLCLLINSNMHLPPLDSEPSSGRTILLSSNAPASSTGWSNITQTLHPPAMAGGLMAYSSLDDLFLLFGGWNGTVLSQTWTFNPKTGAWLQLHPAISPPPRGDGMLTYDKEDNAFIVFGGWTEPSENTYIRLGDTWLFTLSNQTWVERHPAQSPSPRSDAATAFDDSNRVMLVFGGFNGTSYLGDMWRYAPGNNTWMQRSTSNSPSVRADGRMAYDSNQKLVYLFGGNDFSGPNFSFHHLGDTWAYNWTSNKWTSIVTTPSPPARDYPILSYDSSSRVLLLLGGYGNYTSLGDVWVFDVGRQEWSDISAGGGPTPRFAAVGGFDSEEKAVLLFSGLAPEGLKADSWTYRYPPPLEGTLLVSSASPTSGENLTFQALIQGGSGFDVKETWQFGDGNNASGFTASHSYSAPGLYQVRLNIEDSLGQQLTLSLQIPVGFLAPLWIDLAVLSLAVLIVLVLVLLRGRWYHRSPESPNHGLSGSK